MTCRACGALNGAADERCRACGHALGVPANSEEPTVKGSAPGPVGPERSEEEPSRETAGREQDDGDATDDDFEVVLRPRAAGAAGFASPNGGARVPLPGVSPRKPGLVIDLDEPAADRPATPIEQAGPTDRTQRLEQPAWPAPAAPAPAPPAPWQPVGAATVPAMVPPSGPPHLPPTAVAGESVPPWRRPVVLGPIAALLLILVAGGAWLVAGRGSEDDRAAASAIQAGQIRVSDVAERAARGSKIVTLRDVGRDAAVAAQELDGRRKTAATIGDAQLRAQTVALLDAQLAYLTGLAGLQRLDQRDLLAPENPGWSRTKARVLQAAQTITEAQRAVAPRDLPGKTTLDTAGLESSTGAVDKVVRSAAFQLRGWRTELRAYRRRVAEARARAARIAVYRGKVQAALSAYAEGRRSVDTFVEGADDLDFTEFDDYDGARTAVQGFENDRQRTIADLEQLATEAPEGAETTHAGLVEPVTRSLDGLGDLEQAVEDAWMAEEPVRTMASWSAFEALNGDVEAKLEGSTTAWESGVEGLRVAALNDGVGAKPRRPNV